MSWQDAQAMTTAKLVEWLDRQYRAVVEADLFSRYAERLSFDDHWQDLLLYVWNKALTAEYWEHENHLLGWMYGFLLRARRFDAARRSKAQRERFLPIGYATLFGELAELELHRLSMRPVVEREPKPTQLGPSVEWLKQAFADLSPRRKRAVELCIFNDLTVNQAAEIDGCTKNAMNKARHLALTELRLAAEGKPYRTINGYIVELEAA